MLRDGFNATMKDPDFIAEARKSGLAVEPVSGEQLSALVRKIYATPRPVIDKVGAMLK
jgi:tripartite-type tricarboxylate transporter receptor subunit TctC